MYTISKILVPVDFSEHSANGLQYAASLAYKNGAEVIALHVMNEEKEVSFNSVLATFEGWPVPPQTAKQFPLDRRLRERALDLYNFIEKVLPNRSLIKIRRDVRVGDPVRQIVAAAGQHRVDLVVIERTKKTFLSYLRSRSAVFRLSLKLPCPLLLTPPDFYPSWPGCKDSRVLLDLRLK